ncbi:hypothetical protein A2U01_0068066 [Trifolium medium]|uniref:Uncharacterized protein n=1 Tax=Trifolium medium TaxID=97028 RepID=A0A392SFX1_9FABA|nr:hypothetical protein [Trifolium medium]
MVAQRASQREDSLPVAFCHCSEGLSDWWSLSFAVSRPASLTGQNFMIWLFGGFGSEYELVILAASLSMRVVCLCYMFGGIWMAFV